MKVLYFDIDKTLINTSSSTDFLLEFARVCSAEIAVEDSIILENVKEYYSTLSSSTDFDPYGLLEFLSDKLFVSKLILNKIFYSKALFQKYALIKKETIQSISGKYTLGIYSEGLVEYQTFKLKALDIHDYFDKSEIIIARRKLEDINIQKLKQNSIVIDDNPEVCTKLNSIRQDLEVIQVTKEYDVKAIIQNILNQ